MYRYIIRLYIHQSILTIWLCFLFWHCWISNMISETKIPNALYIRKWWNITSWWFQPIWKILVKLDHFPGDRGKNKKCFKPPPRSSPPSSHPCHQAAAYWSTTCHPPHIPPGSKKTLLTTAFRKENPDDLIHPGRFNGWNVQITHFQRNMIWTKPPGNYVPY